MSPPRLHVAAIDSLVRHAAPPVAMPAIALPIATTNSAPSPEAVEAIDVSGGGGSAAPTIGGHALPRRLATVVPVPARRAATHRAVRVSSHAAASDGPAIMGLDTDNPIKTFMGSAPAPVGLRRRSATTAMPAAAQRAPCGQSPSINDAFDHRAGRDPNRLALVVEETGPISHSAIGYRA